MRGLGCGLALALALATPALAAPPVVAPTVAPDALQALAKQAVGADAKAAAGAIAALRARGPAGLAALLAEHGPRLARWFPREPAGADAAEAAAWARLKRALDQVAGQADAHAARLYWHTDLAAAKAAARAAGKPILSLRLLGRLDEALSCANSRFFRVALYAHPAVARAMREGFVLHWASERAAPVVTIDFGGGRVLRRTLTGNSAHLVLDPDGRPLDAIPGLWGPEAFRAELTRVQAAATDAWHAPAARRQAAVAAWHQARLAAIPGEQQALLGLAPRPRATATPRARLPRAGEAGSLAVAKGVSQNVMLGALSELVQPSTLDPATLDRLAAARKPECRLHPASLALMRGHVPPGQDPAKAVPLLAAGFERDLARDTALNAYQLRPLVHTTWLAQPPADADAFVARLYANVFKTPRADPWLGLMAPDAYTGLPRAGVLNPVGP